MIGKDVVKMMDTDKALFGLFFAFSNRLQAAGDSFYKEITCKQFFLLICLLLFPDHAPTAQELADVMGSSHQNVKQILLKLEEKGYVQILSDKDDKRKLRIHFTPKIEEMAIYREREEAFMKHLYKGVSKEQIQTTFDTLSQLEQNLIEMKGQSE